VSLLAYTVYTQLRVVEIFKTLQATSERKLVICWSNQYAIYFCVAHGRSQIFATRAAACLAVNGSRCGSVWVKESQKAPGSAISCCEVAPDDMYVHACEFGILFHYLCTVAAKIKTSDTQTAQYDIGSVKRDHGTAILFFNMPGHWSGMQIEFHYFEPESFPPIDN
jgi:hypothetical protein